jgi:serine/threonine protein kinase
VITPERWHTISELLEQALELTPERRSRFLDLACSSDPSLRSEVQSFLSAHEDSTLGVLDRPPLRTTQLMPGTQLGDYEIVSLLGEGGMGVVYRAHDLCLGRTVAIKVLRAHLSFDPKRLRQFEQEARAAAAINHPNILAVYQMGVFNGAPYLVSEYLEGETLRNELRRGPVARSRSLELAEQIADGLSAAHQRGIIHRDLKPENLFVSADGRVKILDFGLAKLLERDEQPQSETNAGGVAGTLAYLSPEQIRGEKLDPRTDLYSLGVTLYEMATGHRPFEGETSGLVIDAILNRQPQDPAETNAEVHPELCRVLSTALEKDREVRYQSAAEVRADIRRVRRDIDAARSYSRGAVLNRRHSGAAKRSYLKRAAMPGAVLAAAIVVWGVYPLVHRSASPANRVMNLHAQIDPPHGFSFRMSGDNAGPPVIAPNGEYLAFTATGRDGRYKLWVRALDSIDPRPLPDTEGASFPFWSPDSNSLGFFADGKLKVIGLFRGSPAILCDAADGRGGAWGNGEILFTPSPTAPLFRVKASGGTPQAVTTLEGTGYTTHRWPVFLPDREHFLYFAANHEPSKFAENAVFVASLAGNESRPLFHSDTNAIFANGYLLSVVGNNLMAYRFDERSRQTSAEPVLLARETVNDTVTWHADVSYSDNGVLVYGGSGDGSRQMVWVDNRTYKQTGVAVDGLSQLFYLNLSPEGDRIVMQKDREGHDVSVYDLNDRVTRVALPKSQSNDFPIWSQDGRSIAYGSFRDGSYGIYSTASDGSGEEHKLLRDTERIFAADWLGDSLIFMRGPLGNQFQCWVLSLRTGHKRMILDSVDDARLSPDGRWLAVAMREQVGAGKATPPLNLYVMDFPEGRRKYQVSDTSAIVPRWSRDGKEIDFLEQTTLAIVRSQMRVEGGIPLFRTIGKSDPNLVSDSNYFAVASDQRHMMVGKTPEPTVVLVTDFASGLEKK